MCGAIRNFVRIIPGLASAGLTAVLCCSLTPCATAAGDGGEPPPVILISIDTLRADHLSAYGYSKIRTPHLDSFAQEGTLFTRVEAQIPLTLPSHTSLFTSTFPFENGVEENGERVPPGVVPLASVLKSHGYKTAAFLGSDFLDKRYGLDQGFDVYDSPFEPEAGAPPHPYAASLRRDGALVLRAARQWLDSNHGQRVFVFVHLYDLHTPYTLPVEAARAHGISRYDAQLEYVDEVLGRFQQALEESGWWQKSLVVLLSDHGEGLGEHRESDHGFFIYESTLWVPLILHWPTGGPRYPAVAPLPAGLIDVAPTILDFLRLPAPRSFAGASLLGTIKAGEAGGPRAVYSESLYAHDAFRWAPLRAWRAGKYKFIQAPHPELYDLKADPHEQTNLVEKNSALATELQNELKQLLARYAPQTPAPPVGLAPETLERLESVGYLAAEPRGVGASSGPDPKDRLPEYELYQTAWLALEEGRAGAALAQFRRILRADPQNTLARFHLGECYLKTHQPGDALREWITTLKLDPAYAPAAEALGQYWLEQGNYAQARLRFQQTLALAPDSYTGHFELGIAAAHLGLLPEARQHFEAACRINPHSRECARELQALEQRKK